MASLYDLIAQGGTGNPVGSYMKGQQAQRKNRLADLEIAQAQQKLNNPMGGATFGKSVSAWGKDAAGNPVPLLVNDLGQLVQPNMPEGVEGYLEPINYMDLGNYRQGFGSRSGNPVTQPLNKGIPPQNTVNHASDVTTAQTRARLEEERKALIKDKQAGAERNLDELMPVYEQINKQDLSLIYGRGESALPELLRSQKGIDLLALRNQYVSLLQLAAAGKLKGQGTITDSERKTLTDSATVLNNLNISPALASQALQSSISILQKQSGKQQNQPANKGAIRKRGIEEGYNLGKWVNGQGFEVLQNGKLIGYYD